MTDSLFPKALRTPEIARAQAEIERLVPRSDAVSWLYLREEKGDPWKPLNRLFLYQVYPLALTPPDALDAVRGPSPRATGHFCGGGDWCPTFTDPTDGRKKIACPKPKGRWVNGIQTAWRINLQQWEIFQEIGRYADPWWVIQGDRGGHRKALFDWEKEVLQLATGGRHQDVPLAGELPYAPCDHRVLDWIASNDILREWDAKQMAPFTSRDGLTVEAYEDAHRKRLGPMWGQWLAAQVDEMYEDGKSGWRELANEYRAGGSDEKLIRKEKTEMYEQKMAALWAGDA